MTPSWRQKKKVPSSLASLLNRRSRSANLSSGTYKQTTLFSQKAFNQEDTEEKKKKKKGKEEVFGGNGLSKAAAQNHIHQKLNGAVYICVEIG